MSTPIITNKKEVDGISIFSFVGAIDESNADETFRVVFANFFGNKLIFDIGGLTYGNSKFMGYLNKMNDYVLEKEGIFYLANVVDPLADYLEAVGILLVIPNTKTVDEAVAKIKLEFPVQDSGIAGGLTIN